MLTLILMLGACAQLPDNVEVSAGAPVATTAPVGIPILPTPTPIGIPALIVPAPVDAETMPDSAEEVKAEEATVDDVASGDVEPTPEPAAEVVPTQEPVPTATPAPVPTATTEPTPAPTATAEPTATPEPKPEPTEVAAPPSAGSARIVTATGYATLGQASAIPLALPVGRIEIIGFHQAGHPGAAAINAAGTGVDMVTMDSRGRGTHERSAADIVVPPGEIVVAPATGTVIAANDYVLYCKHDDALVYIEPDGWPGWVVKVFHVEGELPAVGARVVAGVTKIADSARMLPFESQVDKLTGEPSWPHVHIEVIDPNVPDTRPPGPGCP